MQRIILLAALAVVSPEGLHAGPQTADLADLLAQLPSAPSGWSSEDVESFSSAAAGTEVAQVARLYEGPDGVGVRVTIINSPAMVMASRSAGTMFLNPTMLEMMNRNTPDKTFAAVDVEGWTGWSIIDSENDRGEETAFNEQLVIKIEIDRATAEVLTTFHDLVDWAALAALQPNSP